MKLPKIRTQLILLFIPYVNISIFFMWYIYVVTKVCVADRTKVIFKTLLYGFAGMLFVIPITLLQQFMDTRFPAIISLIDSTAMYFIFVFILSAIILCERSFGIK
jgi:hypothetical protein